MVKNLPAVQETHIWSLAREDPLKKRMTTHSSIFCLENSMDKGALWVTVHGAPKSDWVFSLFTYCLLGTLLRDLHVLFLSSCSTPIREVVFLSPFHRWRSWGTLGGLGSTLRLLPGLTFTSFLILLFFHSFFEQIIAEHLTLCQGLLWVLHAFIFLFI